MGVHVTCDTDLTHESMCSPGQVRGVCDPSGGSQSQTRAFLTTGRVTLLPSLELLGPPPGKKNGQS